MSGNRHCYKNQIIHKISNWKIKFSPCLYVISRTILMGFGQKAFQNVKTYSSVTFMSFFFFSLNNSYMRTDKAILFSILPKKKNFLKSTKFYKFLIFFKNKINQFGCIFHKKLMLWNVASLKWLLFFVKITTHFLFSLWPFKVGK